LKLLLQLWQSLSKSLLHLAVVIEAVAVVVAFVAVIVVVIVVFCWCRNGCSFGSCFVFFVIVTVTDVIALRWSLVLLVLQLQ